MEHFRVWVEEENDISHRVSSNGRGNRSEKLQKWQKFRMTGALHLRETGGLGAGISKGQAEWLFIPSFSAHSSVLFSSPGQTHFPFIPFPFSLFNPLPCPYSSPDSKSHTLKTTPVPQALAEAIYTD